MESYNIILVDDHRLFREGLKLLLTNLPYINKIQEAADGAEFLSMLTDEQPDIVFMDISMPVMDGVVATRKALEIYPGLNILALSMYGEESYYTSMIEAGAKGFMLKNSGIEDVESAIHDILSVNNYFSKEILNAILHGMAKKNKPAINSDLSEREEEVLFLICKGLSNQEIAGKLFISKRTVDKHRENLLLKTNSKNTAGLVIYAIKTGIVDV